MRREDNLAPKQATPALRGPSGAHLPLLQCWSGAVPELAARLEAHSPQSRPRRRDTRGALWLPLLAGSGVPRLRPAVRSYPHPQRQEPHPHWRRGPKWPRPRLRREHVEWRGPAEGLCGRGAAPGAGPRGWGARFGAPERLLGRECGLRPRGEGGGWAESSSVARPARRPFPPPPSTLLAEASRSSSRRRDGCCGDGSLSADGRELGRWRRRR